MQGATISLAGMTWPPGFNPRPYARGDLDICPDRGPLAGFNPRPYARGDLDICPDRGPLAGFNPRPYARGD